VARAVALSGLLCDTETAAFSVVSQRKFSYAEHLDKTGTDSVFNKLPSMQYSYCRFHYPMLGYPNICSPTLGLLNIM